MSLWATRRKLAYLSIVFGVLFIFIVVPLFLLTYKSPTCFDGRKNGDETGVDCGGSCSLLCSDETLEPVVHWSRSFKVSGGIYTAVAYVENPNISSKSSDVTYTFKIYDSTNNLIAERSGRTIIPKSQKFAILESGINVGERIPATTRFDFTSKISWIRDDSTQPNIYIRDKALTDQESTPKVSALVENRGVSQVENIELVAIVYDEDDNGIAASRTYVEKLSEKSVPIVFTWPLPFPTKLGHCEAPADVALLIDRSGSMAAFGGNPPQPLSDAKSAASFFVDELKNSDQAAVISFANSPSVPLESVLTSDTVLLKQAISKVSILSDGVQNTNIGDSIVSAQYELNSNRGNSVAKKVIVLLTDGTPTLPKATSSKDYPQTYALERADEAKSDGLTIYTIGLGKELNSDFLASLATTPAHSFLAPKSSDLKEIYLDIATAICRKGPAVIEIIPRVMPRDFVQ